MTRRTAQQRPLVVELIGLPGSGKSTIARALGRHAHEVRADLGVVGMPRALLLGSAVRLVPALIDLHRGARLPLWREARQMVRLDALHRLLHRPAWRPYRMLAMEEGPVLVLGWLRVFCPGSSRRAGFSRWWGRAVSDWAQTVDVVVVLDAPEPILLQRIRSRPKPHLVRDWSDREVGEFLSSFRHAFDEVVRALTTENGPRLMTFCTATQTADEIAEAILAGVCEEPAAC
jgi:shikimate kinase